MTVSFTGLVMHINFLAGVMRHRFVMQGHSGHGKWCQSEAKTCILPCPGGIAKIWPYQPGLQPRAHHTCSNLKDQMVPYANGRGAEIIQEQI